MANPLTRCAELAPRAGALDSALTARIQRGRAAASKLVELRLDRVRLISELGDEAARLDRANQLVATLQHRSSLFARLTRSRKSRTTEAISAHEQCVLSHRRLSRELEQSRKSESELCAAIEDGIVALLQLNLWRKDADVRHRD